MSRSFSVIWIIQVKKLFFRSLIYYVVNPVMLIGFFEKGADWVWPDESTKD